MTKIKLIMKDKKAVFTSLILGTVYYLLYLYSVGSIIIRRNVKSYEFVLSSNWKDLIFKQRIAFMWEPFGVFKLQNVDIFVSLNMLLGLLLTVLIILNFASVIYLYRLPKQCRIDFKVKGIWAVLPSFLTGFACCVPTFLIPLASVLSGVTVFFLNIRPFLIPVSILLLGISIKYSFDHIPSEIQKN